MAARRLPAAALPLQSEADFQAAVLEYARLCGWSLRYHTWNSQLSAAGYPDLTLCRPQDGRLLIAELKREDKGPSPAQREWISGLQTVRHFDVRLWRPSDWPEIERILSYAPR